MITLLEKIDAIPFNSEDQIPKEDRDYCELEEKRFKETLQQLADKKAFFEKEFEKEKLTNSCHDLYTCKGLDPWVTKNFNNKQDAEKNPELYNWYDLFKFSSAYSLVDIYKLEIKCKRAFLYSIVCYFIKKYCLDLTEIKPKDDELDKWNSYRVILEEIKRMLGGILDFHGSAVQQAVEEFRELFKYKTPRLNNHIIEVDRFMYWGRSGRHEFSIWGSEYKSLLAVDKAFAVFETETVKENYAIMYIIGQTCTFDWYPTINGEKIEGIKFYKNGKFQIRFVSTQAAKDFFNRFELNTTTS